MNNNTKSRKIFQTYGGDEPPKRQQRKRFGDNLPKVGRSGPAISKHINNKPTWGP